jgi:hypothetical protein
MYPATNATAPRSRITDPNTRGSVGSMPNSIEANFGEHERSGRAEYNAEESQAQRSSDHSAFYLMRGRAQGHPDPDLLSAPHYRTRNNTIDT